ncbi:hypothetical protein OG909_30990 [Streptomyces sp. NBC_01754]|uniref:hypothetical protein n=1 Tax=Streptomyces sp. NBC_01754 TaxID=2975930 RepID=UPI002DDC241D|nr:hypothetical protein [Streptomyces sp. NBC_01754]WSC96375.1 hypothetical protein OG909_30990 [Streptomyces sp. NBC_01754]
MATAPVVSHGPSGIGFVNFGDLDLLGVQAPITTHGTGARGFNLYDGSLRHASFDSIATTGDGATGVQVSTERPRLEIRGDLYLVTVEIDGALRTFQIGGGNGAEGRGSDAVRLDGDAVDLADVKVSAADGQPVVRRPQG